MNRRVLQLPAYIKSFNRKKDKSVSLNIGSSIEVKDFTEELEELVSEFKI